MLTLTKALLTLPLCGMLFLTGCNKADTPAKANATSSPNVEHEAREKMMKEWGGATKTMGSMIKDPSTFKADTFKAEAAKLNTDVWAHFGAGSQGGDAKAEIWSNPAEFKAEVDKYKTAVTALNTAAATATSVDGVKTAFGEVGASCKSCHDKFRAK